MFQLAVYSEPFGPHFGLVMIIATFISIQVLIFARIFGGKPRRVFSKKFMIDNFGQIHKEAFGEEIGPYGFPDTGSGFYSQKLSYKQWWEFNNRQRVHLHFVQWIATYLFLLVSAGSYFPLTSASIGLGIFIVRIWYSLAYVKIGPKARLTPFQINVILTITLGIISILSGLKHLVRG